MVMSTNTVPKLLVPGLHHTYGLDYKDLPKLYDKFLNTITSERAYEEILGMAGLGSAPIKLEGAQLASDDMSQTLVQRLTNFPYGKVVAFTKEQIADEQYRPKLIDKVGAQFAKVMSVTEELLGHDVLNSGFAAVSGAASLMYQNPDGVALFSTAHVLKTGTYSNTMSTSMDFSQGALESIFIQIQNWTDDRGIHMNVQPKRLIIPPALRFQAQRVLQSVLESGSSNNDINTMNGALELVVSPYITASTSYFISTDMNDEDTGLLFVRREEPEMDQWPDNMTKNELVSIYSRMSTGYVTGYAMFGVLGP